MKEKYKHQFMKYIYNELNLKDIEDKLMEHKILNLDEDIDGLYKDISNYFSLLNDVNEVEMSEETRKKYNYFFSMSDEELESPELKDKLNEFFKLSFKELLFPKIEEKCYYYGPYNYKYIAPRDSIALGFNYFEFDLPNENFQELYQKREKYISYLLNYIQYELSKKVGITIAVIKYNEYTKKNVTYDFQVSR